MILYLKKHARVLGCLTLFWVLISPNSGTAQNAPLTVIKKNIVIDPGHGGQDLGVRGTDGSLEKNIDLAVAKTLATKLAPRYTVALCRTNDDMMDVRSRTEIADRAKADLFISIHTGGSYGHESHGIAIYYYKPVSDVSGSSNPKPDKPLSLSSDNRDAVPWNTVQYKYASLSHSLATTLSEHLSKNPSHAGIRVSGLPAVVLTGADMPAVLIEVGQLNNPSEEKLLNNSIYINKLAEEISQGINDYFNKYSFPDQP